MSIFNILSLIGGLALFLFGMETMGKSLEKMAGGSLEQHLENMTSNKIKAVLLGAGVTAVIQSSSATTVMVVGFVNSGIMKLSQAAGIIMGANIGTTATSWILSLTGIEGESIIVKLLKPSSFSPIIAIVGVAFILFAKNDRRKSVGNIMIGFSVLMYGMQTMSSAMAPLSEIPQFREMFTMFSNPLLGLLAGAVLTAIIQSSSASVGILQALCATGAVSFGAAIPIIMGQNIGTCITAILSSIGATKNAKRAALIHLYFNLIGTVLFMVIFYILNVILDFAFMNESASIMGIAVIHSIFNIFATFILLPFSNQLVKLTKISIPEDGKDSLDVSTEEDFRRLDERFLDTPSIAMQQCKTVTISMAEHAKNALQKSLSLFKGYDSDIASEINKIEDKVDKYEDLLGSYLVKLSSHNLSQKESETLSELLHSIGDFERISDHAVNIVEASKELYDKKLAFSRDAARELKVYSQVIDDIVTLTVEVFSKEDAALAKTVEPLEEVSDYMRNELKNRHVERLTRGNCTIELGFVYSDVITNFERIADHCSNIAVCILQLNKNSYEAHEYLDNLNKKEDPEFISLYRNYRKKYILPGEEKEKNLVDEIMN